MTNSVHSKSMTDYTLTNYFIEFYAKTKKRKKKICLPLVTQQRWFDNSFDKFFFKTFLFSHI